MNKSDIKPILSTGELKIGDIVGDRCVLHNDQPIDKYKYVVTGIANHFEFYATCYENGMKLGRVSINCVFLLNTVSKTTKHKHRFTDMFFRV